MRETNRLFWDGINAGYRTIQVGINGWALSSVLSLELLHDNHDIIWTEHVWSAGLWPKRFSAQESTILRRTPSAAAWLFLPGWAIGQDVQRDVQWDRLGV